jgi:MtN3 and saliva related transmembrane protein
MDIQVMELGSIAGTLGGMFSVGAFLPQAYRILQRRSAADVSLAMYVAIMAGCVLWMFYAYVHGSVALFATNLVIFVIAIFIAALRLRFGAGP